MPNIVCDADTDNATFGETFSLTFVPFALSDIASALGDALLYRAAVTLVEGGALVSDVDQYALRLADETADFTDVAFPVHQARVTAVDTPRLTDAVSLSRSLIVSELADFSDEATPTRYLDLVEDAALTETYTPTTRVVRDTLDAMAAGSEVFPSKGITALDAADFATTLALSARATRDVADTADFATTVTTSSPVAGLVEEAGDFGTVLLPRTTVVVLALDEADLDAVASAGGSAWAANTDTWAASRYDPFSFTAAASLGGRLFATGDAGLFRLEGATDAAAPIAARVDTGLTEFKEPRLKLAQALYFGYRSDSPLTATMGVTDDGAERQYDYSMPARAAAVAVSGRIPLGRGLRSRYMRVVLENSLGGFFDIEDAALEIDVSARRV